MLVERGNSSLAKTGINQIPARVRRGQVPPRQGGFWGRRCRWPHAVPSRDPGLPRPRLGAQGCSGLWAEGIAPAQQPSTSIGLKGEGGNDSRD